MGGRTRKTKGEGPKKKSTSAKRWIVPILEKRSFVIRAQKRNAEEREPRGGGKGVEANQPSLSVRGVT